MQKGIFKSETDRLFAKMQEFRVENTIYQLYTSRVI